jgi:hypothetical protein
VRRYEGTKVRRYEGLRNEKSEVGSPKTEDEESGKFEVG